MRDPYRDSHQKRVSQLACAMAREMDLPEERVEGIRVSNVPYLDIGTPDKLLKAVSRYTRTDAPPSADISG